MWSQHSVSRALSAHSHHLGVFGSLLALEEHALRLAALRASLDRLGELCANPISTQPAPQPAPNPLTVGSLPMSVVTPAVSPALLERLLRKTQ